MMGVTPLMMWAILSITITTVIGYTFLIHDTKLGWCLMFFALFLFRYVRLFVNAYVFYFRVSARQPAASPQYLPSDVTVVVPTKFSNPPEHIECINRILQGQPGKVAVVTATERHGIVYNHLSEAGLLHRVELLCVERFDKKLQMVAALRHAVETPITCFADDDVQWPVRFIPTMLACFENPNVGACGPSQRVQRDGGRWKLPTHILNFIGICYLERRNFNAFAFNHMDGAVSTLSGRTSLYRSIIVKDEEFYNSLLSPNVGASDDKALTRYVFSKGWQIDMQYHPDARIITTLENSYSGLYGQCVRWARGSWKGNNNVMATARYWCDTHTWSLYAIYISQYQQFALLWDPMMVFVLYKTLIGYQFNLFWPMICWGIFIFCTKLIKIIGHLWRHPIDVFWIGFSILFSYYHTIINLWALITANNDAWGTRTTVAPTVPAGQGEEQMVPGASAP